MRALAGPAMLLVLIGGYGAYRCSAAPATPPRAFLDLELAGADPDHTGSCYSLSTVVVANLAFSSVMATWQAAGEEAWTLSLEDVSQGIGGPTHVYQRFTFRENAEQVRLIAVAASEGQSTEVGANIDALLAAPNERRSTTVERCLEAGATGYRFKPRG